MTKTKTINLRVDVERLAQIDAAALKAGKSRSEYMVLRALAAEPKAAVLELAARIPTVTTASQLPASKDGDHPGPDAGRCPRCNSKLIHWSTGWMRCRECARNWPAL